MSKSPTPEPIADGVSLLRGGFGGAMNVVLIDEPDGSGVTVFDAGEKGMAQAISDAAAARGGVKRIVLGHADNDHRGAAPHVAAPVFCHRLEVAAAEAGGHRDYWRMNELPLPVRLLHRVLMRVSWEGGPTPIAGTVAEGDEIAGFRVIDLPGHAPGLIGLFRERDRVALVSDCFYMTSMYGKPQPPAVPLDPYNQDTEQARASIAKLADLEPAIVVPGHLGPLTGPDVVGALRRAASA
ncbi:MBL fold metallo-hydrolase [Patulibacter defluvii]|uniref:MBL fold metallo-hydrolase n=1 Tax=Patulibacter defluvii TaxID=3095358 RepID=UPI002A754714|nr:MBL fold metallo-hydrolase [Patulibacter sp. DM4]